MVDFNTSKYSHNVFFISLIKYLNALKLAFLVFGTPWKCGIIITSRTKKFGNRLYKI